MPTETSEIVFYMDTSDRLMTAISTGEVLKIRYSGGSAPGAIREIAPIQILGDKVSARCYTSNAVKTFAISKISILDGQSSFLAPNWQPKEFQPFEYLNLKDVFLKNHEMWCQFGWHVNYEDNLLSLHRARKNGRPLKGSDVSLNYEEYTSDFVMGLDGKIREENVRKRVRPWVVRGKGKEASTFGSLEKAIELFHIYGRVLAPSSGDGSV